MFADNPDFYPTPRKVARMMLAKISDEAQYYLEPSAGKGDIADVINNQCTYEEWCEEKAEYKEQRENDRGYRTYHDTRASSSRNRNGDRIYIDVIENYPDLISVLRGKQYDVVGCDWLTYEGTNYYDAIVMNPPFSEGAKHLLKAFDFLHAGEIVCLLNEETINNPHTEERKRLLGIIESFGNIEYLGDCFSTAEHKTSVKVAMVYIKKEAADDAPDLWAKKPTAEKEFSSTFDGDLTMLAIRDNLGNMEHWYNMANQHWMIGIDNIRKASIFLKQNKIRDTRSSSHDDDFEKILGMALNNVNTARAEFLRRHRRLAWTSVFEQMEFGRWLDSKQQERFLRDVERDSTIPFTAENIRGTLDNVFQSRKKLFEESVASVFDALCSHSVENGSGPVMPNSVRNHWRRGEGWKTNDNYKVNKKLIFPWGVSYSYGSFNTYSRGEAMTIYSDLDRILCVLDGKPFDQCRTIGWALDGMVRHVGGRTTPGGWTFESEYFEGRFFKKGTLHLKWKRDDLWERFNITAAAGKKWLGEDTQQYRPKKRSEKTEWYCEQHGHSFKDGVCARCHDPEVDEVAAVECDWCRAIFEHTGRKECPIHRELEPALPAPTPILEAPKNPEQELREMWTAQGVPLEKQNAIIAINAAKATPEYIDGMFKNGRVVPINGRSAAANKAWETRRKKAQEASA